MIDGAFTDNTGIGWAVAAGATEVLALANGEVFESSWTQGFSELFAGAATSWGPKAFGGEYFQLFEETEQTFQDAVNSWPSLELASGSSGMLTEIRYGTLPVTTVANEGFGIVAGRAVTLKVVAVTTRGIAMGVSTDYFLYSALVNDITSTFAAPANRDATQEILKSFYLSAADTA